MGKYLFYVRDADMNSEPTISAYSRETNLVTVSASQTWPLRCHLLLALPEACLLRSVPEVGHGHFAGRRLGDVDGMSQPER